jgi:hypothetical protein
MTQPINAATCNFIHEGMSYEVRLTRIDGKPLSLEEAENLNTLLNQTAKVQHLLPQLIAGIKADDRVIQPTSHFTMNHEVISLDTTTPSQPPHTINTNIRLTTEVATKINTLLIPYSATQVHTFKDIWDRLFDDIRDHPPLNTLYTAEVTRRDPLTVTATTEQHIENASIPSSETAPQAPLPESLTQLSPILPATPIPHPLVVDTTESANISPSLAFFPAIITPTLSSDNSCSFLADPPSEDEKTAIRTLLNLGISDDLSLFIEELKQYYTDVDKEDVRNRGEKIITYNRKYLSRAKNENKPTSQEWEALIEKIQRNETLSNKEKAIMRIYVLPYRRLEPKPLLGLARTMPSWNNSAKMASSCTMFIQNHS